MKFPATLAALAMAVLAASGVAAHRLVPKVAEIRPGAVGGGGWAEDPGDGTALAPRSGRSFHLFPSSAFGVLDGERHTAVHSRRFGLFSGGVRQAELVLPLGGAGEILAVMDGGEGLVLVSGSPVEQGSLAGSSLTVWRAGQEVAGSLSLYTGTGNLQGYEGRLLLWRPEDPGAYLAAEYTVEPNLALADPAGHPIHGPPGAFTYLHTGRGDVVWSAPTDTPVLTASAVGNDRFLHARPWIDSIALYDYRARFYDPATSTFLEPDPLGPVDSPNLYQAFGLDGLNVRDPSGMGGPFGLPQGQLIDMARVQGVSEKGQQELLLAHRIVGEFTLGIGESALGAAGGMLSVLGGPGEMTQQVTAFSQHVIRRASQAQASGGTMGEGLAVALGDVTGFTPLVEAATGREVYGGRLTGQQMLRRVGSGTFALGLTTTGVAGGVKALGKMSPLSRVMDLGRVTGAKVTFRILKGKEWRSYYESFSPGSARLRLSLRRQTLYRAANSPEAARFGEFASVERPSSPVDAILHNSLHPRLTSNRARFLFKVRTRFGLRIEGTAAPQGSFPGGYHQVFQPKLFGRSPWFSTESVPYGGR